MTDNQNPNPTGFNILQGAPQDLASLSPEDQFNYMQADPEIQRAYLNGDAMARMTVDTATKNFAEWQQRQKEAELREAKAKHHEFLKSVEQEGQTRDI